MPSMTVTLVGNLTREPELRFTSTGQSVATFGVAVNRRRQSRTNMNEKTESVSFFTVVAWGSLAENLAESLQKGSRVVVTGRLEQRTWLDNEGERHTVYEVLADEVAVSLRWATAVISRVTRTTPATTPAPFAGDDDGDDDGDAVGERQPVGDDADASEATASLPTGPSPELVAV